MTEQLAQSILSQLESIRWILLTLAALCSVMTVIVAIDYCGRVFGTGCSTYSTRRFHRKATKLLAAEKYSDLIRLAQSRIERKAHEPFPYRFLGVAQLKLGETSKAQSAFEKLLDVEPGWKENIQPYIDKCKSS